MRRLAMTQSTVTLSSLYSSGQCLLSVLGSVGVILLFAGIPQLIYSDPVNPASLMTFLLGALLISLMVAGNAFIGYKYRKMVRRRREEQRAAQDTIEAVPAEDKPPSYDDLLKEEGAPPEYAVVIMKEKPPRYEEVTEVFNWPAITKASGTGFRFPAAGTSSDIDHDSATASVCSPELPIIAPLQRRISETLLPFRLRRKESLKTEATSVLPKKKRGSNKYVRNTQKIYNRSISLQGFGCHNVALESAISQSAGSSSPPTSTSEGNLISLCLQQSEKDRRSLVIHNQGSDRHRPSVQNSSSSNSLANVHRTASGSDAVLSTPMDESSFSLRL